MGMQNGAATLEDSLAVPYNIKNRIIKCFSNFNSRYIPKRSENKCLH